MNASLRPALWAALLASLCIPMSAQHSISVGPKTSSITLPRHVDPSRSGFSPDAWWTTIAVYDPVCVYYGFTAVLPTLYNTCTPPLTTYSSPEVGGVPVPGITAFNTSYEFNVVQYNENGTKSSFTVEKDASNEITSTCTVPVTVKWEQGQQANFLGGQMTLGFYIQATVYINGGIVMTSKVVQFWNSGYTENVPSSGVYDCQ